MLLAVDRIPHLTSQFYKGAGLGFVGPPGRYDRTLVYMSLEMNGPL